VKILPGKTADNWKEAATLAFQEAGAEGMSTDIVDMFTSLANDHRMSSEADTGIKPPGGRSEGLFLCRRYGNKATWRAERGFVPVPKLHAGNLGTGVFCALRQSSFLYAFNSSLLQMTQST